MKHALHIFRKDVRSLRLEILVMLALYTVFAWAILQASPMPVARLQIMNTLAGVATFLMPIWWFVLISQLVRQEQLPGVRQYWLTRPIAWGSLLGAKLLFVVAFVNVPLFATHCVIVSMSGFDLASQIPMFLWMQAGLSAGVILPALALAAVTRSTTQMALTIVAFVAFLLLVAAPLTTSNATRFQLQSWGSSEWIRSTVIDAMLILVSTAIILMQYTRRRTAASRLLGSCAIGIVLLSRVLPEPSQDWALGSKSWLNRRSVGESEVLVSAGEPGRFVSGVPYSLPRRVAIGIPVQVAAVPDGLSVKWEESTLEIESLRGSWRSSVNSASEFADQSQNWTLIFQVDKEFMDRVKNTPVTLRGSVGLGLYDRPATTRLSAPPVSLHVPGLGILQTGSDGTTVLAKTVEQKYRVKIGIAKRGTDTLMEERQLMRGALRIPFPMDLRIVPMDVKIVGTFETGYSSRYFLRVPNDSDLLIVTEEPLAFVRRRFELRDIRLSDYQPGLTTQSPPIKINVTPRN